MAPEENRINGFNDKSLKNSLLFIRILQKISPKSVSEELITPGVGEEEVKMNAKYAIALARKINISVFLVWQNIKDLNSKFLLTFTASLYREAKMRNI